MKRKVFLVVAGVLVISGCSRKTPVETVFNNVENSVVDLENALPVECKNDAIAEKITRVRLETAKAQTQCESEIARYKIKYNRLMFTLILIFLVWTTKKFLLKY